MGTVAEVPPDWYRSGSRPTYASSPSATNSNIMLSLNDGAAGYFETDKKNRRTFEVVAQALRKGGGKPRKPRPLQIEIFVEENRA